MVSLLHRATITKHKPRFCDKKFKHWHCENQDVKMSVSETSNQLHFVLAAVN